MLAWVALGASGAADLTTAGASNEARTLYRASELQIFAETFRGDFLRLWEKPSTGVSSARAEIVSRQIDKHFGADVLNRLLLERFAVHGAAAESRAIIEWAGGPVGKSVTGRPRARQDSDLFGVLEAYAKQNTTAPIEQARVKLLAQISRESLLDQVYISSTSVSALLVSITLALNDDPVGGAPKNTWERLMPELFAKAAESMKRYTQATAGALQVEHEHVSNSELGAYLTFRQSSDGRWLSKEAATALLAVLRAQHEAYTADLRRVFSKIQ
jgi:hypothetical protein